MGSAFEFPQGKAGFAEFMTIREGDGGVVMLLRHFDGALARAWEERDAPMVFTAVSYTHLADAAMEGRQHPLDKAVQIGQHSGILDPHQHDRLEWPAAGAFELHGVGRRSPKRSGDTHGAVAHGLVTRGGDIQHAAGLDQAEGVAVFLERFPS